MEKRLEKTQRSQLALFLRMGKDQSLVGDVSGTGVERWDSHKCCTSRTRGQHLSHPGLYSINIAGAPALGPAEV